MKNLTPPKPKKKSASPNGEVTIYYNNPIEFPDNFVQEVHRRKNSRILADDTGAKPLIEILSIAGPDSNQDLVGLLDWNITGISAQEIVFKVFYEHPLEIS